MMADLKDTLKAAGLVGSFGQVLDTTSAQENCGVCTYCVTSCAVCVTSCNSSCIIKTYGCWVSSIYGC